LVYLEKVNNLKLQEHIDFVSFEKLKYLQII
jgi:hypothetical protein